MLQPRTAIFHVERMGFCPAKRRITSSSGRLRKKNVPVNCLRFARRQISLCNFVPYQRSGIVFRSLAGSRFHSHELSRIYRLTGDLVRTLSMRFRVTEPKMLLQNDTLASTFSSSMGILIPRIGAYPYPTLKGRKHPSAIQFLG